MSRLLGSIRSVLSARHDPVKSRDLDEGSEIGVFLFQFLGATMTTILTVLFRRNIPSNEYGDWWWSSLFIFSIVYLLALMFRYFNGETLKLAIYQVTILSLWFTFISIVFNSVWRHGSFWHEGYFEDAQSFFGSEIMIGTISALSVSILLVFLPPSVIKRRTTSQCNYDIVCPKICKAEMKKKIR